MPTQAALVVSFTKRSAWLRLRGSQATMRGEVSAGLAPDDLIPFGGRPWLLRRFASPIASASPLVR